MGNLPYRVLILIGLTLPALATLWLMDPLPQPQWYHDFADQRCLLCIPHELNVVSNLPFVLIGLWGVAWLLQSGGRIGFRDAGERWPYVVFFLFIALTGIGSAYYHADPTNDRLLWDRMPLAVACMTLLSIVIAERVDRRVGMALLIPLMLLGAGSVIYWHATEVAGHGDMRLYLLVQLYPLLLIPALLMIFPATYTRTSDFFVALACYVAAKVLELLDKPIFHLGQMLSGHTLKHLVAAMSAYVILTMIQQRRPVTMANSLFVREA